KAHRRRLERQRRHARILKRVRGTAERPRLVVRRSLRHMEAQLVDDDRGVCITGVSTRSKEIESRLADDRRKQTQSKIAG
ncbi:MAG: 50S ribosomal protein L18, partial [Gemmatimonadetes bacterium]|nr:50S ribosomal protein L18 [Gemmatimonadota bacterium]NIS00257.1 50S ribosomal protein L18 [Gemmatimonadota bacterium]NIT69283.1 50S ribosomal protein L18 [Gemmatimonadota bacterium]NIU53340.1 50S ribosomal protein L18 [Gemmatimonadota bacterium]NIW37152.1 50S ribosomal protein L18 [Gemmatimonadota bacterium]